MIREKFDLNGKVSLVTGSTKGIGLGIVQALAEFGSNVIVVSRHLTECQSIAKKIKIKYGVSAQSFECDVTVDKNVSDLLNFVLDKFGKVDVLVNNVGKAITKKAEDVTYEEYKDIIEVNLNSIYLMCHRFGRQMIKQKYGKIINISSIFGEVVEKQILPYNVSKGGVNQLTKSLALEWAKYNIYVNAIAPAYILTELNKNIIEEEKVKKHLLNKTPLKRFGSIDEVASVAVFLASDASSYIIGQVIPVDGGWLIT